MIYLLTLIWMSAFTGLLLLHSVVVAFIASFFLGMTMTGFLPIGFEYAAELTYPANEALTSGLINASAQAFGIIFTIGANQMSTRFDSKWINTMFTGVIFLGFVLLLFIKEDLRRLNIQRRMSKAVEIQINKELNTSQVNTSQL